MSIRSIPDSREASWSTRDEQGFRIYGVVGRLDAPRPELSLRVGVYGHFAPVDWLQVFDGPNPGVRFIGEDTG